MRLLENPCGRGALRRGDTGASIDLSYEVSVYQDEIDLGHGRPPIEGLNDMEAVIDYEGDLFDWVGVEATLMLGDGRRLDGFVSDGSGTFTARSALHKVG